MNIRESFACSKAVYLRHSRFKTTYLPWTAIALESLFDESNEKAQKRPTKFDFQAKWQHIAGEIKCK